MSSASGASLSITDTDLALLQEFIGGNSDVQAIKGKVLNEKLAALKKA